MKISTKGIYALEAMIELACYKTGQYVSIREIAEKRDCSTKYLEQIFQPLKRSGLIESTRGKEGGYKLARTAEQITAKEIVIAVEGNLEPVFCISKACPREEGCTTKPIWVGLQRSIYDILQKKTLKELATHYLEVI